MEDQEMDLVFVLLDSLEHYVMNVFLGVMELVVLFVHVLQMVLQVVMIL